MSSEFWMSSNEFWIKELTPSNQSSDETKEAGLTELTVVKGATESIRRCCELLVVDASEL